MNERARTWSRLAAAWLAVMLVAATATAQEPATPPPPPSTSPGDSLDGAEIYRRLLAGVVWVTSGAESEGRWRWSDAGTGWLVDGPNRLVVTNHHVVNPGAGYTEGLVADDTLRVYFPRFEGGRLVTDSEQYLAGSAYQKARIVDSDPSCDLAILQLATLPPGAEPLPLAARSARPGDTIHLVGNPDYTQGMWIYTSGTVRQVYQARMRLDEDGPLLDYLRLESQMPTNTGDSGGPVVDGRGKVVGVNHAGIRPGVANLMTQAIDVAELKDFLAEVRPLLRPRTAADYASRGLRYHERGRLDDAFEDFNEALRLDPENIDALYGRARIFHARDDHDTAVADLDKAIRLGCTLSDAYNLRGLCRLAQNRHDEALADITEAIRLDPNDAVLYNNRGDVHYDRERYDLALADYDAAIRLNPDRPLYHGNRGYARKQRKEYDQAVAEFQAAIDRAEGREAAEYVLALGRTYLAAGRLDEATAVAAVLEKGDPDFFAEHSEPQHRKYLKVANNTNDTLTVYVKYHTRNTEGEWNWYPSPPGDNKWATYTFKPGEASYLNHEDFRINADRVRICAYNADRSRGISAHQNRDLVLAPEDGYPSPYMTTLVYTLGGDDD